MCACFRESGKLPTDNALLKMNSRYLVMLGGSFVSWMVAILVGSSAFCLNRLSAFVISVMVIGGQSPFSLAMSP